MLSPSQPIVGPIEVAIILTAIVVLVAFIAALVASHLLREHDAE